CSWEVFINSRNSPRCSSLTSMTNFVGIFIAWDYAIRILTTNLSPFEEHELLRLGYGITNLVPRATNSAAELAKAEYLQGAQILEKKLLQYKPGCVAFIGLGAYRAAFNLPTATVGAQSQRLYGAMVWTLPSTSGLNANYCPDDLARLFAELRKAIRRD
nr:mismatch-specific DNA-glycosylase [Acidobacteriota bacterium]